MKALFAIVMLAVSCATSGAFVLAKHMGFLSWQWLAVFAPIWIGSSLLLAYWGFWMLLAATRNAPAHS